MTSLPPSQRYYRIAPHPARSAGARPCPECQLSDVTARPMFRRKLKKRFSPLPAKPGPTINAAHEKESAMAFELPSLPYAYDALQPYMSKETLEFHHDKHHQAYVTNGNNLLKGSGLEDKSLEDVVKLSYSKNAGLFNNAGQHFNHIHFWKWMKKGGGGKSLPGPLQKAIDGDLGGYDKFRTDFIQAGTTQFGSGWAWLAVRNGKLE